MKIKILDKSNNPLPAYETELSAGMDLRADILEPVVLKPFARALIPTGIHLELPKNMEAQVRPRSGLAAKHGITVLNAPGTVDADYRGNVGVILINLGYEDFTINHGDRIAQLVFAKVEHAELVQVDALSDSGRGTKGFGHSGIK